MSDIILSVKNLKKYFSIKKGSFFEKPKYLKAVNDVSFDVYRGETLGIIGESGCGKSTLGKTILQLTKPTSGSIAFKGRDIANLNKNEMKKVRKEIQVIFQDPYSSLDPRKTTGNLIEEPLNIHNIGTPKERKERVHSLLQEVGLSPYHATRFPHEFSGGQRQRINIARALTLNPELIICDEPVSALDVSVQAQVINLFKELQQKMKLTYLFISHDLSVVKYLSDRIIIMYLGQVMEMGKSEDVYRQPLHPYTKALFSAIPPESPFVKKEKILLQGEIPSPMNLPKGCPFSTRCPHCMKRCNEEIPQLRELESGHTVACYLYE